MGRILKIIFFALLVKPVVLVILGLNLRGRKSLPIKGPAVIVANHNSHLDALVLMSLYPLSMIHKVRPVAAVDYFLSKKGFLSWLSLNCINIVPMKRKGEGDKADLFSACHQALDQEDILILFPEGSRGKPEQLSQLKKGVYYLLSERNDTQATPVMIHGLGRSLPKGEAILVPFNCDVIIDEPMESVDNATEFISQLDSCFERLAEQCITKQLIDKEQE